MTARTLEQLWHAHETRESLALALQRHHDEGIPQAEDLRDTAAQWSRQRNDILAELAIMDEAWLGSTFHEVAMLRQAETHARLNSLHSSCSALWVEIADDYRDRADALMAARKSSEPAAPVITDPGYPAHWEPGGERGETYELVHTDFETKLEPGIPVGEIVPPRGPAAPVLDMTKPAVRQMLLHMDKRMTRMSDSGFLGPIVIMDGELRFLHGLVKQALRA